MATTEERIATLEAQLVAMSRDVLRCEAHLEDQDRKLDRTLEMVTELARDKKLIGRVVHWFMAIVAGLIGYSAHRYLP